MSRRNGHAKSCPCTVCSIPPTWLVVYYPSGSEQASISRHVADDEEGARLAAVQEHGPDIKITRVEED